MPTTASYYFTDLDEFREHVRTANVEFLLISGGKYEAELQRTKLGRLWLQRGRQSLAHVSRIATSADQAVLLFPAHAHQPPTLDGRTEVRFGDIIFFSGGSDHYQRTPPDIRWASVSVPPTDLAAAARTLARCDLPDQRSTRVVRPLPALTSRLLNLHNKVSDLAAAVPETVAHPEVARVIGQGLVRTMIACLEDQGSVETRCPNYHAMRIMNRFERVLEANPGRPLYLTELCAEVGVSARMLRLHCQEYLGMPPTRYLWLRRMHLARRALASADPIVSNVTKIANDYGFGELGRFAVTYRKLFGESPSATLLRQSRSRRAGARYHEPVMSDPA